MGRELHESPRALVLESPSRGLDVRATASVHDRMRRVRDDGAAVVVYSSDIDELLELSDRVVVCYSGSVRHVPVNMTAIARAMVGADT
jgi:simple sugar transport system ATP-binding protein